MTLLLLLACTPSPPSLQGTAGPNLLLITVDTLRADHLGAYGYSRNTTPEMDRLAKNGVRFTDAYTPRGLTWPALASLMTGLYPVQHGVRTNAMLLENRLTTLAEVLTGQGYKSGAILTNSFDQHWEGFPKVIPIDRDPRDGVASDQAQAWLSTAQAPFFLWVHFVAPHDPWVAHEETKNFQSWFYRGPMNGSVSARSRWMLTRGSEEDRQAAIDLYDGEVVYTDAMIGELLEKLDDLGLKESTLVALTADHGEELGDHGHYLHHQSSPWEGVARVPLILSQPGVITPGVLDVPTDLLDVGPTLLELLGKEQALGEGRSLVPLLRGESLPPKLIVAELEEQILILRSPRWTYIQNPNNYAPPLVSPLELRTGGLGPQGNAYALPRYGLYDRLQDRYERVNLAEKERTALREMQGLATLWAQEYGWPQGQRADVDPDLRAKMEALGYWFSEPTGTSTPGSLPAVTSP
ncbi:MAG TPA: sulfatase [Myxococcota bacterium]|nr:sulfatase [Myxococcota bacterium]